MWVWGIILLNLLVWPLRAWPASIQYVLSSQEVRGVSDAAIPPVEGRGVVTIPEAASAIVWPVPAGCPAGTGQPLWTRLTNPAQVTAAGAGMEVRPALVGFFFTSTSPLLPGCHLVQTAGALRTLVQQAILTASQDLTTIHGFAPYQNWYDMQCRGSESNSNCQSAKANLDTMQVFVPGRGQLITETGKGATLASEAEAFRAAKGW